MQLARLHDRPISNFKNQPKEKTKEAHACGHCADTCVHTCAYMGPLSTSTSTRAPRPHTSLVPTSCEAGKALEPIHSLTGARLQQTAKATSSLPEVPRGRPSLPGKRVPGALPDSSSKLWPSKRPFHPRQRLLRVHKELACL